MTNPYGPPMPSTMNVPTSGFAPQQPPLLTPTPGAPGKYKYSLSALFVCIFG